jgi:hypothetical protein
MAENMDATGSGEQQDKRGLSRRTVLAGAAWSVPVIAVATAAPAMAASPPVVIDFGQSTACKIPGNSMGFCYNKGYVLWARFVNETNTDYYVTVTGLVLGLPSDPQGEVPQCVLGMTNPGIAEPCPPTASSCMYVPANQTTILGVFTNANADSGSDWVTVSLSLYTQPGCGGPAESYTLDPYNLTGGSWTGVNPNGAPTGSCVFPYADMCFTPPTACGTSCSSAPA